MNSFLKIKVRPYADLMYLGAEEDSFKIAIKTKRSAVRSEIDLGEFDEIVWSKCLKEASKNSDIVKVRNETERLWEETHELIDEITRQ